MTIKEMHIGIDLGLQKVNTNRKRNIMPEEKDWYLNNAQLEFIRTRSNPKTNSKREGFEDSQKRYDDLKELKTSLRLTCYTESLNDNKVYSYLPYNYLQLIDSRSYLSNHCNGINRTVSSIILPMPGQNGTYNYTLLPFPSDLVYPFYSDLTIQQNSGTKITPIVGANIAIITGSGLPYLSSEEAKFEYIKYILNNFKMVDIELYWERYDNIYSKNSFVVIDRRSTRFIQLRLNYTISLPGVTPIVWLYNTSIGGWIDPQAVMIAYYNNTFRNFLTKPNREYSSDGLYAINENSFTKTKFSSPLCYLQGSRIYILHDNTFTPINVIIDYLRTPKLMDSRTNDSCELSPNIHGEIINLAIQNITAELNDPNYRNIVQENAIME